MTATLNNGTAPRTRRQLNDSIAKMDHMIDGLADAIPGAVREALEEHVSSAIANGIKEAVLEVLSNPDLLSTLRGVMPQQEPPTSHHGPQGPIILPMPRPSLLGSMVSGARSAVTGTARWCRDKVVNAGKAVGETASNIASKLSALRQRLWMLRLAPKALVVAIAVGSLAAAVAAIFVPHWMVITLGGIAGVCVSITAQMGSWLRNTFGRLALASD